MSPYSTTITPVEVDRVRRGQLSFMNGVKKVQVFRQAAGFILVTLLLVGESLVRPLPVAASRDLVASRAAAVSVLNCVRDCNSLLVPVEVNGRTCLMLFDTGAENITISRKQMRDLGLATPSGQANGAIQGIGAAPVVTWKSLVTVRVGNLICQNFPLNVLNADEQNYMHPIIGRNFFKNYTIKVDPCAAQITLMPAGALIPRTTNSVSLDRFGNQLLLPVAVNGRQVRMLFDTGADGITFSEQQAKALNLIIPANAERELHLGVAGLVEGVGFMVPEIRMGPIIKWNVKVSVIKSPGMPYPLLGGDYFRDLSYTIDEEHSQLAFEFE